jgi:hypothetical protein
MVSALAWQPAAAALCSMHAVPKAASVWLLLKPRLILSSVAQLA